MLRRFLLGICVLGFVVNNVASLECYTCDSAEDSECATKPGQQINVEECLKDNDQCVTVIVSGITRRGCLSRIYPNLYCPEPCDRCSTNLCNRYIFPVDRLRCYQCAGAECLNVSEKPHHLLPCPVYHEKDRCYMNVIGITNVQRGCEHTNLPATCPNSCLKCNYNGCNNEVGVHEETCLECSHTLASPNPDCFRQQSMNEIDGKCSVQTLKSCTNKLLHGHRGQCYTYINEQTGIANRGCSSTMGFYPSGNLTLCDGENCNTKCFDISCNTCSSDDENPGYSNCRTGVNLKTEKCSTGTVDCYSCESGSTVTRGCADATVLKSISSRSTNAACYTCRDKNGCNRSSVRSCYQCSSLEDAKCSEWPQDDSWRASHQNCSSPTELCVSTLVSKLNLVYTLRGCASQVPECSTNDPYCVRCNASLCNTDPLMWKKNNLQANAQIGTNAMLRNGGGSLKSGHGVENMVFSALIFICYQKMRMPFLK